MFPKILFPEKQKILPVLFIFFILVLTFLSFFLDIATRNMIAFDIFYFPSIMLVVWYFGNRPGFLMVILIALLWSFAQGYEGYAADAPTFFLDAVLHFIIFALIFGLTGLVRRSAKLLEQKSQELARSNKELEQFAFRAAHDLKAPLTTILGFTQYLEEKYKQSCEKETKACMEGITKGVWRMNAMVKALLDYASVSKKEAAAPAVESGKAVGEALENLRATIAEKKAEVTFDPLPALAVNPALAGLVFQNLIGNALKYCEREPRIHLSAVRQGKEWIFSVRDNGIGIPEESRERVFMMFEKLATPQAYPGSGIGLATCQKIVERYGGRIWVESQPGEGSTFFFTLPAA